jgi:hypothetical protein
MLQGTLAGDAKNVHTPCSMHTATITIKEKLLKGIKF